MVRQLPSTAMRWALERQHLENSELHPSHSGYVMNRGDAGGSSAVFRHLHWACGVMVDGVIN